MKRILFVVSLAALALLLPAAAQDSASHPDFSGQWDLVKGKSDFGKMPPPVNMTLISEKKDGYLHSVLTTQTAQGDEVSESDWYPDGKRHTYSKPVPGYSVTRWEGDTLVNEQRSNDRQYRQTVKLSVEANGKEAVETITAHTPNGDNQMRLVWRRH